MKRRTIYRGAHIITVPLGERFSRLVLFVGQERSVLFDTGCAGDVPRHVLPQLTTWGIGQDDLSAVIVSHCDVDHFGGLGDVEELFPKAERIAHTADADLMDVETYLSSRAREFRQFGLDEPQDVIDWSRAAASAGRPNRLIDGDIELDLGDRTVTVLHVPGHSLGHLAVWDPAEGVMAVSDAVLGRYVPYADGSPSFPPTYRHAAEYLRTIDRLEGFPFRRLITAHYPDSGIDAGRSLLERSRAFAQELDDVVRRSLVERGPLTLAEVVANATEALAVWPTAGRAPAMAQPVMAHLEKLEREGVVSRIDGREVTWESSSQPTPQ